MNPSQLKETTMDVKTRRLIQISLNLSIVKETDELVDNLMGKNPEYRFNFISKNAKSLDNSYIVVNTLDEQLNKFVLATQKPPVMEVREWLKLYKPEKSTLKPKSSCTYVTTPEQLAEILV